MKIFSTITNFSSSMNLLTKGFCTPEEYTGVFLSALQYFSYLVAVMLIFFVM